MARSRRNRSRRRLRSSRFQRRNVGVRKLSSAPPRLSITANTRRLLLPFNSNVSGVTSSTLNLTFSGIFNYPPNRGLVYQYTEVKVHRVRVYWQSDNGTSDAGSACLVVSDFDENSSSATTDFGELMSYPGAMTRKVWQNVSNVWFPTEPTDRNWMKVDDTGELLTVLVRHSVATGKLFGRIMCLCSVVTIPNIDIILEISVAALL